MEKILSILCTSLYLYGSPLYHYLSKSYVSPSPLDKTAWVGNIMSTSFWNWLKLLPRGCSNGHKWVIPIKHVRGNGAIVYDYSEDVLYNGLRVCARCNVRNDQKKS